MNLTSASDQPPGPVAPRGLPGPRRPVLADLVTDAVRAAVFSGELPPGERLRETELARTLQVSRGPVREALLRLGEEGLVVHETHRGASVIELSRWDIEELLTLRNVLERLAVRWASRQATADDLADLDRIVDRPFATVPRWTDMALLDVDFHDRLVRSAHHGRLYRAWLPTRSPLLLGMQDGPPYGAEWHERWQRTHRALVDPLRVRSEDAADREYVAYARVATRAIALRHPEPARPPEWEPPPQSYRGAHGLSTLALAPASRRVLPDEVADAIRVGIMTGDLSPGSPLREDALAAELGVSRGPVREALPRLAQEGLVVLDRSRDARVVTISRSDVHEIFSVRLVAERLAGDLACRHAIPAGLDRMRGVLDEVAALPPVDGVTETIAGLDLKFHDALFRASGHRRLHRTWLAIRGQLLLFLPWPDEDYDGPGELQAQWLVEHRELLDLVEAGDLGHLDRVLTEHVRLTYERALASRPAGTV